MENTWMKLVAAVAAVTVMAACPAQEAPAPDLSSGPVAESLPEIPPQPQAESAVGAAVDEPPPTLEVSPPSQATPLVATVPASPPVMPVPPATKAAFDLEETLTATALWTLVGHFVLLLCYSPYLRHVVRRNRACVFVSAGEKTGLAVLGIVGLVFLLFTLKSGVPALAGFVAILALSIALARRTSLKHALGEPQPFQVAIGKAIIAPWTLIGPFLAMLLGSLQTEKAYAAANQGRFGDAARHGTAAAGAFAAAAMMGSAFDTYLVNGPLWYESHGLAYEQ